MKRGRLRKVWMDEISEIEETGGKPQPELKTSKRQKGVGSGSHRILISTPRKVKEYRRRSVVSKVYSNLI